MPHTSLVILLALMLSPVSGTAENGFYSRDAEGWFWYNDEAEKPPSETTSKPKAPEPPAIAAPANPPPTSPAAPTKKEPPPFSVAWIKEKLPEFHARALDNPTRENVAAYLYLQRVALDKAETFTQVAQRTVSLDPLLDENVRRPIATFASRQVDAQASISARKTLAELARNTGIFFFFRSDCPYCEMQAPILAALSARHGFRILPVSLDGQPLPSGLFPDFRPDRGQAETLGVIATPAMFLVRAPNHFVGIGQGALAKSVLEKRILSAAAEAGWIDRSTLQASRAVRNDLKLMPSASTPLPSLSQDPAAMIEYLRNSARGFRSP